MPKNTTEKPAGYGNIYTPHAGSMIIQVQRESGLANRTFTLTLKQVKLLRAGAIAGGAILAIVLSSWIYLAAQASRVPTLTRRIERLQTQTQRLDSLQVTLGELERRYSQVQRLLASTARPDSALGR